MTINDDPLVLASDPQGLRKVGIPIHPRTALQMAKAGTFPAPQKLSPHKTVWFLSALQAWKESKRTAA